MKVLFLCTGNSVRSQMAEAVLRHQAVEGIEVFSAGTAPQAIDPRTLSALADAGVSTAGLSSKPVEDFADQHFDYVITLCDKAHNACQQWPGAGVVMAWDFPDPKASDQPQAFAHTLQEVSERIRLFLLVNSKTVSTPPLSPVDFFKALADDTRLLSMLLITERGERCVCDLMEALNESQPKISRHLAQLRKRGILQDRRQGQWVYYQLHPALPEWAHDILKVTLSNNANYLKSRLEELSSQC